MRFRVMNEELVKQNIISSLEALQRETPPLNFNDVHERSTAHRLATHMEPLFEGWNIDCEYNRDIQDKKLLQGIAALRAGENPTDSVFPDIIVHAREERGAHANLLVVELKRNSVRDDLDFRKLELFTDQAGKYQYKLGRYLNNNGGNYECIWCKNGEVQR